MANKLPVVILMFYDTVSNTQWVIFIIIEPVQWSSTLLIYSPEHYFLKD